MTPSTLRLKQLAEAIDPKNFDEDKVLAFAVSANPEAVLGLIARIEKLEAALEFYAEDSQFSSGEKMTDKQKRDMDDYGHTAREALKGET